MKIFWGCQNKALFIDLTSMAKLWLDPSDITEAPVVKPDSELIQEVVLPVDLILVTPFRSKSPVLRCFFSLRPCKINNIVSIQILAKLFTINGVCKNRALFDRKFKIDRIVRFLRFQRFWTRKICGISWVINENLWDENSACQVA